MRGRGQGSSWGRVSRAACITPRLGLCKALAVRGPDCDVLSVVLGAEAVAGAWPHGPRGPCAQPPRGGRSLPAESRPSPDRAPHSHFTGADLTPWAARAVTHCLPPAAVPL